MSHFRSEILLLVLISGCLCEIMQRNGVLDPPNIVKVNKCCDENELYVGKSCVHHQEAGQSAWRPVFFNAKGEGNINVIPEFVIGYPDCGSHQKWPVYHNQNSSDTLLLLPNGVLRHFITRVRPGDDFEDIDTASGQMYHDYEPGKYCLDKKVEGTFVSEFAWVCSPKHEIDWTTTEFVMRNIISPVTHIVSIGCFLMIAVTYFVVPTLRDLTGNLVTSICLCLLVSQAADLIRLLTVFNDHLSRLVTDSICYFSLLAAFFWLNSLGFYVWKTFRSRNVFLRMTDGKKYCYYSLYVWSVTLILGTVAIFAHFTMDYPTDRKNVHGEDDNDEIGSLGLVIFFVPVAFTILIDVFFLATTLRIINRMHTYGRIHHKLRHSFRMFILLLIITSVTWMFFLLTFPKFDSLIYCYIVINALQGPLVLYVCIFNQKHVAYLLRKTCCYSYCTSCQPQPECEWGDEMSAMNASNY